MGTSSACAPTTDPEDAKRWQDCAGSPWPTRWRRSAKSSGPTASALEEAVERARPERALAALSAGILNRARGRSADPACAEAARRLRLTPNLAIPALAAGLGLSARQLERRFRAHVGLPPKAFARVARFDRAVRRLGDGTPLALLALDCGYADQAHFSHEFRSLAGMAPRAYVANRQDADAGTS